MRSSLWLLLSVVTFTAACQEDPNDPKTWIKKLNKPDEQKTAMRELVKLKDPVAVEPLIELYDKTNKDPDVLKAIATFKDKRALKTLIDSLDYADGRNCDNAATAANALGDMPDPTAVDPLVTAVTKPLPVSTRCNVVKLEAMKSIGKIHDPRAVPALTKVLQTPAEEQDFFLNLLAADTLGELGDPRAVPALVRALFMTGRRADAFQNARVALLAIGKPAVPALIDAMQGKNAELNGDAKKYQFRPGVIVMKTSKVLGDARAPEATAALLDQLKKPSEGDAYGGVLRALGKIGDPAATKEIVRILTDPKQNFMDRSAAAEALTYSGDKTALPALLNIAKTGDVMKDGQKYPDVRMAAATAYSLIAGAEDAAAFTPLATSESTEPAKDTFDQAQTRLQVATECKQDVSCYGAKLNDQSPLKQEKAAFALAQLGAPGLPPLLKAVGAKELDVRRAVLWSINKLANQSNVDAQTALKSQIEIDREKPVLRFQVEEMRATLGAIRARAK
jgi:HEAT repeat protein